MFEVLLFSFLLLFPSSFGVKKDWTKYEEINAAKHDYCQQNCDPRAKSPDDGGGTHAACDCTRWGGPHHLLNWGTLGPIVKFRQVMVDFHNHWRNFSAGGGERRPENDHIPAAADMEVMNYDLELEFIARCRAMNTFGMTDSLQEHCMYMASGRPYSQNVGLDATYWHEVDEDETKSWEYSKIRTFYEEVRHLKSSEVVHKFDSKLPIGRWSTLIWHDMNRVGCVRLYHPKMNLDRLMKYVLICNYACDYKYTSANVISRKIFTSGKPCSKCPGNKKCHDFYTALCGELKPTPRAEPYIPIDDHNCGTRVWRCYSYCKLAIFLLNYMYFVVCS